MEALQRNLHTTHRPYRQPLNKIQKDIKKNQLIERKPTCATWEMLYRFPNRVNNSIASFVLRASGSSREEFGIGYIGNTFYC